jgi:hypothetical protein
VNPIWNKPEYDAFVIEGVARGDSHATIAEGLRATYGIQVTKDAVRGRLRRGAVTVEPENETTAQERFDASIRAERKRAEDRAVAIEMTQAVKAAARWQDFLDTFQSSLGTVERPKVQPLTIPTGTGTPEQMVVLIGDVHVGKLADPNVVGSEFGYDVPIFRQRMARLKDRILRLYALNSNTAPITSLRIYFLGDGVDGTDMRRGHAHRVDQTVQTATAQVLLLTYEFETMVRELSATLQVPIEIVWEFGNHGRVGDFGVNLPADNWDYMAGQMLGVALRDMVADGRVKLHADSLKYSITQLGPLRVYTSHNDGIKGGDGFAGLPINGMARGSAKDTGLHQQLFDLYIMAHFHTPQDITTQTSRIIMNGAWDGGDDYSVNGIKAASEPVQWAFGVHPTKGMTWQARINLSPTRRAPSPVVTFE